MFTLHSSSVNADKVALELYMATTSGSDSWLVEPVSVHRYYTLLHISVSLLNKYCTVSYIACESVGTQILYYCVYLVDRASVCTSVLTILYATYI